VIPTRLEDWTLEVIQALADSGANENDVYDFKADLQPADHQRKSVAAFANTRGGFLIFGVTNNRRLEGVTNSELPRDFGVKLRSQLEPSIEYRFRPPLDIGSGRQIFVVEVPRSPRAPHAVSLNGNWTFLKRTPSGNNDPMTYEEVRSAFAESNQRRSKLAFIRGEFSRLSERAWEVARELGQLNRLVPLQEERVTLPYGASLLEAHLPELFSDIVRNDTLRDAVNQVRESAREADDALARYFAYAAIDPAHGSGAPWYDYEARAKACAHRIISATRQVLSAWQETQ
jgi:hypothetical protein